MSSATAHSASESVWLADCRVPAASAASNCSDADLSLQIFVTTTSGLLPAARRLYNNRVGQHDDAAAAADDDGDAG